MKSPFPGMYVVKVRKLRKDALGGVTNNLKRWFYINTLGEITAKSTRARVMRRSVADKLAADINAADEFTARVVEA